MPVGSEVPLAFSTNMSAAVSFPVLHAPIAVPSSVASMTEEAFRALVEREGSRWLRLAVRLAGEADGPDVLQEALVKAWLGFADGSAPTATHLDATRWVVRVVVNQAYDTVRAGPAARRRLRKRL
jgi:DNA-directed RNA polymerase specialized sigma24 family protein